MKFKKEYFLVYYKCPNEGFNSFLMTYKNADDKAWKITLNSSANKSCNRKYTVDNNQINTYVNRA